MAATIVVTAGVNVRTFNITTANQQRIITAIERSGMERDPDETGTDMNDFDYFNAWLKNQYSELLYRTERRAAQQGVTYDPGAIDTP